MMQDIDSELKEMGLQRSPTYGVGKKIDHNIWVHKSYVDNVISKDFFEQFKKALPDNFDYELLRINLNNQQINFIQSPDFNESHEPLVGNMYKISMNQNGEVESSYIKAQQSNPLIYHHK